MTSFDRLLQCLSVAKVEFVIVGGVAAVAHGSARTTQDLDVVYSRDPTNLERLVSALSPHKPYLRGAPPGLPFKFDLQTLRTGLNFTLTTSLGWIDLLGEIAGGFTYESLLADSFEIEVLGVRCRLVSLETLIETKRAAGRPKDFESLAELELLRDQDK